MPCYSLCDPTSLQNAIITTQHMDVCEGTASSSSAFCYPVPMMDCGPCGPRKVYMLGSTVFRASTRPDAASMPTPPAIAAAFGPRMDLYSAPDRNPVHANPRRPLTSPATQPLPQQALQQCIVRPGLAGNIQATRVGAVHGLPCLPCCVVLPWQHASPGMYMQQRRRGSCGERHAGLTLMAVSFGVWAVLEVCAWHYLRRARGPRLAGGCR